jgi:glycerol-3-phosphate dehydrogenase (NAD(P)+)
MIGVLGGGAFGTALAALRAGYGAPVRLWARDPDRVPQRLPGVTLPPGNLTGDLSDLDTCDTLLLAVPMQALAGFLGTHRTQLDGRRLVACAKGIDLATGLGATATIAAQCPAAVPMVLTGPGFAADIAAKLPTAMVLAGADPAAALAVQAALAVPSLRLYLSTDTTGAELGGALKNVIAIACGAAIGEGMGESARAALLTRGLAEMTRLAVACGGRAETLAGLSGLGDLVLTATSETSRNYRFGLALGRAEPLPQGITVEGTATARAALRLAATRGVDLPITAMLVELLDHDVSVAEAIRFLLSRPLTTE